LLELEGFPLAFLLCAYIHALFNSQSAVNQKLDLHLFHVDNSTRKMQTMADWYKDIPYIEYVLPSSIPWYGCVTFGVIYIVKWDKTNIVEQGWLSSMYFPAHYFILFL
jgi:hypothetical protein